MNFRTPVVVLYGSHRPSISLCYAYGSSLTNMSYSQDDREPSAKRRKLSTITSFTRNLTSINHVRAYHQHNGYNLRNDNFLGKRTIENSDSCMTDGLDSTSCPSTAPSISGPPENGPLTEAKDLCEGNFVCREVCFGMVSFCKGIQIRWKLKATIIR